MKLLISFFSLLFTFGIVRSQDVGVHFGHQVFGVMSAGNPIQGISLGLDVPRSGFVTPYGQLSLFIPQRFSETNIGVLEPNNPIDPYIYNVNGRAVTKAIALEFGTIYYLGGAYDYGFSVMLHNSVRLMFMPTKVQLEDVDGIDLTKYNFTPTNSFFTYPGNTGFALNTSFGLGAKYTFDWGSLYAMGGIELILMGDRFPQFYYGNQNHISPFAFSTRIGIRRELDFSGKSKPKKAESEPKDKKPSKRDIKNKM